MSFLFDPYMSIALFFAVVIYWGFLKSVYFKKVFLFLLSSTLLCWIHPVFFISFLGFILFGSYAGHALYQKRLGFGAFCLSLGVALVYWTGWKYGEAYFGAYRNMNEWWVSLLIAPLGISYVGVRFIQYLVDSYRGRIREHGVIALGLFLSFFPLLAAGPIETYQNFDSQTPKAPNFAVPIRRMVWGYFKKLFLGELVLSTVASRFAPQIYEVPLSEVSVFKLWGFGALSFVQAYVDLSAYTDIAIGCSLLFGYHITENFKFPFLRSNLAEFWRGWHISLSSWCKHQIFMPVLSCWRSPLLAMFASMVVMGLWHSLSIHWFLWGLYHAAGLSFLFVTSTKRFIPVPRFVGIALTWFYVSLGFLLVAGGDSVQNLKLFVKAWTGFTFV